MRTRQAPARPTALPYVELAHAYAHEYARTQRELNSGHSPLVREADYADKMTGQVPYWDIDPETPGARLLGRRAGTPFLTREGKLRVFAHYLNTDEMARLNEAFGGPDRRPTGTIEAEMTSSFRTLVLFPAGEIPYMLKFDGVQSSGWASKGLTADHVRLAVSTSTKLRRAPGITPEPSGLVLREQRVNAIYRPLPLPTGGLRADHRLLVWHSMGDRRFAATDEGKALIARHGSIDASLRAELARPTAELLYDLLFVRFVVPELHSQNLDVVLAGGRVDEVRYKDLHDVAHDPALQAASGRRPWRSTANRSRHHGQVGWAGRSNDLFLDLTRVGYGSHREVPAAILAAFADVVAARMDEASLARFPDHARFRKAVADGDPRTALSALRSAVIKERLTRRFRVDRRAASAFRDDRLARDSQGRSTLEPGPDLVSSSAEEAHELRREIRAGRPRAGIEYGYVGKTPVAVVRQGGRVDQFYFAFD